MSVSPSSTPTTSTTPTNNILPPPVDAPLIQSNLDFPSLGISRTPSIAPPPPVVPLPNIWAPNEHRARGQDEFMAYNSGFNDGYVRGYYSGMNTMASKMMTVPVYNGGNPNRGGKEGGSRGRGGYRGGGRGRGRKGGNNNNNNNYKNKHYQRNQETGQSYALKPNVHQPQKEDKIKKQENKNLHVKSSRTEPHS